MNNIEVFLIEYEVKLKNISENDSFENLAQELETNFHIKQAD
jgi:hypothetical protein